MPPKKKAATAAAENGLPEGEGAPLDSEVNASAAAVDNKGKKPRKPRATSSKPKAEKGKR